MKTKGSKVQHTAAEKGPKIQHPAKQSLQSPKSQRSLKSSNAPAIGSKEFKALQAKWYTKLANTGFVDAENGYEYSPYMAQTLAVTYKPDVELYYQLWSTYLQYNQEADKRLGIVWALHAEGITYRAIESRLKAVFKGKKPFSIFWLHGKVSAKSAEIFAWNKENPNGYLYGRDMPESWLSKFQQGKQVKGTDF